MRWAGRPSISTRRMRVIERIFQGCSETTGIAPRSSSPIALLTARIKPSPRSALDSAARQIVILGPRLPLRLFWRPLVRNPVRSLGEPRERVRGTGHDS